jgi:hypothetical protein
MHTHDCDTDFQVTDTGSVVLLLPHTAIAKEWVEHNLPNDVLNWGPAVPIERNYWPPIYEGIIEDGLTIS